MNDNRWIGVVGIVLGILICAWQWYEVSAGSSLTVWVIFFIPVPIVALGGLFILGGLLMLAMG